MSTWQGKDPGAHAGLEGLYVLGAIVLGIVLGAVLVMAFLGDPAKDLKACLSNPGVCSGNAAAPR